MYFVKRQIDSTVWVAPGAVIAGENVRIGRDCTIWYNAVVRGDFTSITIGSETNIQDCCIIHGEEKVTIGNNVSIGHGAIVHGATVEDGSLIGMGAIVMDGAVIGKGSLVGAGAMVTHGKKFPEGSLILGSPAKFIRKLTAEERQNLYENSKEYLEMRDMNR